MTEKILAEFLSAYRRGESCALATIASVKGSAPRQAGTKMLIRSEGEHLGTIGGGKLEALLIADCFSAMQTGQPVLKTYVLRDGDACSFGAVCGGEIVVLIEPCALPPGLFLFGAGHCAQAIAQLGRTCGFRVTVIEDRAEMLANFDQQDIQVTTQAPSEYIAGRVWRPTDAIVLLNRRYDFDRDALEAILMTQGFGYLGMIGSRAKVHRVYRELAARGIPSAAFAIVHAPIGLDIGADSPAEIAVSVLAEILATLRNSSALPLRSPIPPPTSPPAPSSP